MQVYVFLIPIDWRCTQASHLVEGLADDRKVVSDLQRMLLEQRYCELLMAGDFLAAVSYMRDRLTPLADEQDYTSRLAAYVALRACP